MAWDSPAYIAASFPKFREKDRYFTRLSFPASWRRNSRVLSLILSEREAVLFRHHDVEDTDIVFAFEEGLVTGFAVDEEIGVIALCLKVFPKEHTQVLVVFTEKNSHSIFHSSSVFRKG